MSHKEILDLIDQHADEEIESHRLVQILLEFPREDVEEIKDLLDVDIYEAYLVERWDLFQGYGVGGMNSALSRRVDKVDIVFKSFGIPRKKEE
jgi:hypothetical protein